MTQSSRVQITFCVSSRPNQAKLGNSWVSPNVGHLILKYLCPALHEVLQDGLKAYVLDLIIGQRRCQPWSLVEASTQLGEKFGGWYDLHVCLQVKLQRMTMA